MQCERFRRKEQYPRSGDASRLARAADTSNPKRKNKTVVIHTNERKVAGILLQVSRRCGIDQQGQGQKAILEQNSRLLSELRTGSFIVGRFE
jgi:hypothetical protein